jgi:hypothetical protein
MYAIRPFFRELSAKRVPVGLRPPTSPLPAACRFTCGWQMRVIVLATRYMDVAELADDCLDTPARRDLARCIRILIHVNSITT